MTVVGMDGAYLKPFQTEYVMITPGQTMDVLVTAGNQPSLYYMAAKSFSDSMAPSPDGTTTAIIEYVGNYTTPSMPYSPDLPQKANTSAAGNFTVRLRSVASKTYPVNVPQEKDLNRSIFITAAVGQNPCTTPGCVGNNNSSMRNMASLNNVSIVLPSISYLQAYYGRIAGVYNATFPNMSAVVYDWTGAIAQNYSSSLTSTEANLFAYGSAVEIIFQGTNSGAPENHPMHLHGQSFYVVGMGYGNYTDSSRSTFNEVDPPYLNTIGVPTNGWTAIRFWAKNPGVWFMHCHLEKHVSWGMGTVFITLNGNTPGTSMLPQPKYMPPC
ncbi:hypothetical protein MLD38_016641 [Melastoma candidum]|uniref:Uncharacterized protein n=1 Tax=Melastoma candidum TaxID=119954 RepID=A0ACB9QRI3_9MYRT|nr:hypothetical protein MLD38_016641 [Melastoma candidum]